MIGNNNDLADILRVCEIKDLIWVMRFQSPKVYIWYSPRKVSIRYIFGIWNATIDASMGPFCIAEN